MAAIEYMIAYASKIKDKTTDEIPDILIIVWVWKTNKKAK